MFHVKHHPRGGISRAPRTAKRRLALVTTALAVSLLVVTGCTGQMTPPQGWAPPVATANGTLLVQSGTGRITALNAAGERITDFEVKGATTTNIIGRTSTSAPSPFYATPLVDGSAIYLATYAGQVLRLNLENGTFTQAWRADLGEAVVATPVLRGTRLYVSSENGHLLVLDTGTGKTVASFQPTKGRVWGAPALQQNRIFIGTLDSSELVAVNADSGAPEWKHSGSGAAAADIVVDGDVLLVPSFDRALHALDIAGGTEKWRFTGDGWFVGKPLATQQAIYVATMRGSVYALDRAGKELWHFRQQGLEFRAAPVLAGGTLVVADRDGTILGLNPADGTQKWTRTADKTTIDANGTLTDAGVYFVSTDHQLLRVDPASGDIRTFNVQPPQSDGK